LDSVKIRERHKFRSFILSYQPSRGEPELGRSIWTAFR
jgi:hypothetical protein